MVAYMSGVTWRTLSSIRASLTGMPYYRDGWLLIGYTAIQLVRHTLMHL